MRLDIGAGLIAAALAAPAAAQPVSMESLSAELSQARTQIAEQRRALDAQEARLQALEGRLAAAGPAAATGAVVPPQAPAPDYAANRTVEQVGEAPPEIALPEVAVLGDQGSVITNAGQLTAEAQFEYARADRNRVLFRGIEVVESVLIGVFDINESRQDVLTTSAALRYGLTDRLEVAVRLPFVHRSDTSILTPVQGDMDNTIDNSVKGSGIGDLELSARYQLTSGRRGSPLLIGNLQLVAPTGSSPFDAPRDAQGRALEASTGAGFWAIAPSLTMILPSDPAVLFATIGYTHNFGETVNARIPPVVIERVKPGDSLSASLGIGLSLNQRTSFNLGYAHSWGFGTETTTRLIAPGPNDPGPLSQISRDLQIGRLLFGVSYRLSNSASVNWAVEVGATEDAPNVRTVLRIPLVLSQGR
jgi:uncharacterized coiled-coil protein SlyX